MKLEQVYDGRFFPCYYYEPNAITVAVTSKAEPEDTEHITWLFLPMIQEEIDRALLRGGITDPADVRLRLESSQLPDEVDVLLEMEHETLADLNELATATDGLSKADMEKLGAVVILAEPKSAAQIKNLAESLDLFDFAPGTHYFFLGATTPAGFKGYFEPLRREPGMQMVLIKSGPGCGKSTLMKQLARRAIQQGEPVECIHCASDPDSFDGVIFVRQRRAIVDATAPHTIEPDAPGADEVVLSLYHTIQADALRPHAEEVKALFARNAALRARAARYVASAGSLLLDSRRAEACSANFEKVRRYVKRLCTRLLPRTENTAREELRLLSAVTPKGEVFYQHTAQALADRFIVFRDEYGAVSRLLLELIRAEALARGYHIITCPCAMHPEDKIDHILIPELRLAFLTDNRWHRVQLPGMQAVRCTRFLDRENLAGYRARLRFNERAAAELLEQATALMAQAKSCHDELETYYRTTVDFAQVDEAAARCAELFGLEAPSPDC